MFFDVSLDLICLENDMTCYLSFLNQIVTLTLSVVACLVLLFNFRL